MTVVHRQADGGEAATILAPEKRSPISCASPRRAEHLIRNAAMTGTEYWLAIARSLELQLLGRDQRSGVVGGRRSWLETRTRLPLIGLLRCKDPRFLA